ncbi:MAG: TerB N-terminal domain-containing protein [Phycisphaerae bacterium]|nr:TerB N-terminal domain-containing protein [Phycisphaerae bacterium]
MAETILIVLIAIVAVVLLGVRDKLSALLGAGDRTAQRRTASRADRIDSDWRVMAAPSHKSKPKWLGYGDVLQVKGFEIAHPLTYLSSPGGSAIDPSEIDRSLPIARDSEADDLPYWPWYARMNSAQRHIYLDWLSSDRAKLPNTDGYLFVYYYGLERRALVDDADHKTVFEEVQRLRQVYEEYGPKRGRNSFMNYSSAFLWFLAAYKPDEIKQKRVQRLAELTRVWNEEKLAAALAWCVSRKRPLPSWLAFAVAEQSPQSQRSVVTKRVGDEFRVLFAKRYQEQFTEGLPLRTSKRERHISYRPASAVIDHASLAVPNALGIPSQFKLLSSIWNGCIDDLRKLSAVTREKTDAPLTAKAWEAMPPELRRSLEHPQNNAVCDLIAESADEDGHVFVRAGELARAMQVEKGDRLTIGQSRAIAATVEHIGFALEPDPRLTGKSYKADSLIAAFPQAYEGDPDYKRYGGAACMMRLGLAVAEADGHVDDEELHRVRDQIEDGFELNDHERRRLEALQTLLIKTGSDIAGLGKRLQEVVAESGRRSVGKLLIGVAACDGVITKGELRALRKCFRSLGLTSEGLDAMLQELASDLAEAPVSVTPGRPREAGEPIPLTRAADAEIQLDREAIARIMHETRDVSALLAKAMDIPTEVQSDHLVAVMDPRVDNDDAPRIPTTAIDSPNPSATSAQLPPARFAAFYTELVTKKRWTREDAAQLARRHGHMLSGAIESINEWAFDEFGAQLVYDGEDDVELELDLLEGSG